VRERVQESCDIATALAGADPDLKANLYVELGVQVPYGPVERVITATAGPSARVRVGGASATFNPRGLAADRVGCLAPGAATPPLSPLCPAFGRAGGPADHERTDRAS